MLVTLKLATSLDGRIATALGESKWITGVESRQQVHRMRASHDAVLVGVQTVLADDPELNVRLDGYDGPQPARIILDSKFRTPASSRIALTVNSARTFLVGAIDPPPKHTIRGATALLVSRSLTDDRVDIPYALEILSGFDVASILVEGGGQVATSFLKAGLVDRLEWFRAPILLGGEGRPCVAALALADLAAAPRFRRLAVELCGDDLWERYERL